MLGWLGFVDQTTIWGAYIVHHMNSGLYITSKLKPSSTCQAHGSSSVEAVRNKIRWGRPIIMRMSEICIELYTTRSLVKITFAPQDSHSSKWFQTVCSIYQRRADAELRRYAILADYADQEKPPMPFARRNHGKSSKH